MPLPFWPFRKPKTKLELFNDALHNVVAGAQAKIEDLPLERAAEKIRDARHSAGEAAMHGWEATTRKTSSTLHTSPKRYAWMYLRLCQVRTTYFPKR